MPSISQAPELPGGVGGFASIPKFATCSDSSSPSYETTDISGGVHAEVWATYNKVSEEFDEKRLKKWNEDLDVLLIFVSLLVNGVIIDSDWTETRSSVQFVLCYRHSLPHQVIR